MAGFRLPAYDYPQNALLNLAPINAAITDYRQREQQAFDNERQNKLLQLQQDQFGLQKGRFGMEQQRFTREQQERDQTFPLELERSRAQLAQTQAQTGQIGKTGEINEFEYARRNGFQGSFQDWQNTQRQSNVKTSLQPIYGVDENNNPVVMQPRDNGTMVRSEMPPGVTVSRQPIKVDTGTEFVLLDPVTRQPVGRMAKDVVGESRQKVVGRETGELEMGMPKASAALEAADAKSDILTKTISEAKAMVGPMSAGMGGALLSRVPGTVARDLSAKIDTLKANAGFQELQSMRDNSPTGGALGQVAVQELAMLQATITSLEQAQTPAQLMKALNDFEKFTVESKARRRRAFEATYSRVQPTPQQNAPTQGGGAVAPGQYVYDPASGRLVPKGGN